MCSVQGCAKQPPTKEPLACLALECQPAAGVRGRATPLPSSPWPPPQPHCLPSVACALVPAPGPAVSSLACPCSLGHSLPRPTQKDAWMRLADPQLPWPAGALLLMAAPIRREQGALGGSPEQAMQAAPLGARREKMGR